MSIWVLRVEHPRTPEKYVDWYFNDPTQFYRAYNTAYMQSVLVEGRSDYITDADEFEAWLQENA